MRMDRHHLLEIILWPNDDGTFRKILNSRKRLIELGIYYDWKLTITIPVDKHISMHNLNRSDATKAKLSAAKKGENHHMYGKTHSEEARAKISEAQKGKKLSEEHRAKLSAAHKGKKCKKFTSEHRAKISEANKGRSWYNNGITSIRAKECPLGFTRGRIYKIKKSS